MFVVCTHYWEISFPHLANWIFVCTRTLSFACVSLSVFNVYTVVYVLFVQSTKHNVNVICSSILFTKLCDLRCLFVCSLIYLFLVRCNGESVVDWWMWFTLICLCSVVDDPILPSSNVLKAKTFFKQLNHKSIQLDWKRILYTVAVNINVHHVNVLRLNRMWTT